MKTLSYALENGIATLTFDEPDSPVNTMCLQWQDDLSEATARVLADRAQLRGLILASAKSTFFAGADLKAVMRLTPADAPQVFAEVERMKKNFRTLETLGIPVVSCLGGSALGGGWEVALIGHHRIAVDQPRIQLGLPEVSLGLLPGASGVTKMVRHLGLLAAQPYLMEGKLFSPRQAAEMGLVHELVATDADLRPQALACMVEGSLVDMDTALRIESRYLAQLMTTGQAQAMINTFFFNLNAVKSGAARPKDVPRFKPQKVGVVGAGMMGAGIAWAQASRGMATVLVDTDIARAEAGKAYSHKLSQQRVDKGRMTAEQQAVLLARITATDSMAQLQGCELVIEAVFEQRALKARITQETEQQLAPGAIMASNTSTLPIGGLAQASSRPEQFIGIHFFSPVDKMQLVEIIRGPQTSDSTVAQAMDYVQALGKLPIVVNDSRGFYTSRTFGTYVMEGAAMLGEGIPAAVIENAAVQAGMPVGPLAVIDETSLTLAVHVLEQTRADLADQGHAYTPTPGELLVEKMVQAGRGGRATGAGFYDYPADQPKHLWPGLQAQFGKPGMAWDLRAIKDRLLYRQAVETARCLAEGVLTTVHEANIGSIFGIGFPAWTGGALQFIYGQGVAQFAARSNELAQQHGEGFRLTDAVQHSLLAHQPRW